EHDADVVAEIEHDLDAVTQAVEQLEFQRMFSGEADANNAFVDIQAGSGGTEAQDWAGMLLRMYLHWCEQHGFETELLEVSAGDVAGIKSARFSLTAVTAMAGWGRKTGWNRLCGNRPTIRAPAGTTP